MKKLIDIHCHLSEYINDIDLEKIDLNSTITHVSTALNKEELNIHEEKKIKYWFAGIHPWDSHLSLSETSSFLNRIPYDKIIGMGEIGLDRNKADLEKQEGLLLTQLKIAWDLNLPTLYHLVGNEYDFIKIHKKINLKNMKIIHAFNSSYEVYRELDKLGFYFSLGSRILSNPKKVKMVGEILNSKRFFLESDAPNHADLDEVKRIAVSIEMDYNIKIDVLKEMQEKNFNNLLKEACESISKK